MKCLSRGRFALAACLAGALLLGSEAQAGLTCVPFARSISAVKLEGDAWVWWGAAADRYHRSQSPSLGAVLVMKRTARLQRGHVAVVSAVLGPREILLDHANWIPGAVARGERAIDVSPRNDWSQVRVWHEPSAAYGVNVYPSYGFVHPTAPRSDAGARAAAGRNGASMQASATKGSFARPILPAFKPRPAAMRASTTKRDAGRPGAG